MIRIFKYLIVTVIISGCSNGSYQDNQSYQDNGENFQTWLAENRIQPNDRLIEFNYELTNKNDIEFEQIEKIQTGDTLIVSFYSAQPVGCLLIGDIEILQNVVKLKFGQACNPYDDGIVTEVADLLFTYKIKAGADLNGVPIKLEGLTELIK